MGISDPVGVHHTLDINQLLLVLKELPGTQPFLEMVLPLLKVQLIKLQQVGARRNLWDGL